MRANRRRLTGWILVLLLLLVGPLPARSQDAVELPAGFDELIALKTELLQQYSELQSNGQTQEALGVLRRIVDIHRKALQTATAQQQDEAVLDQLRTVYGNDTEYLSDELFSDGEYAESAKLRDEVRRHYAGWLGADHSATQIMRWKTETAEKLSAASPDQQEAYAAALQTAPQAAQALQDGDSETAVQLFRELFDAEIAVLTENHPDVSVTLNNYGRALSQQQNYDAARTAFQRSLRARQATTGRDLQYAAAAFNLGQVYQTTGEFQDAEQQYLVAAEIEEAVLGVTHESFQQTLQQLANLYEQSDETDKLTEIQQRIAAADPLVTVIGHLPQGTYAAAAIRPSSLIQMPELQLLPFEIVQAAGQQELGLDPFDVDAAVFFATQPLLTEQLHGGVAFRLRTGATAEVPWLAQMQPVPDQPYVKSESGLCFVEFQDGVAVVGTEIAIQQCLTDQSQSAVASLLLADRDSGLVVAATELQPLRPLLMAMLNDLELPLESLRTLPLDVHTIQLRLTADPKFQLTVDLNATDEQAAERVAQAVTEANQLGLQLALQELSGQLTGDQPVEAATRAYAERIMQHAVVTLQPEIQGASVLISSGPLSDLITTPMAAAILLPAVQSAREAALRTQSANDLKRLAIALLMHHDAHNHFPARASYAEDGTPLLSWRVHLLPFLDEQTLYDEFHLDEPWDSEHNLPLADRMPDIYDTGSLDDISRTVWVTWDGPGSVMEGRQPLAFKDITDGTSLTAVVAKADADAAVIWTKPEDLKFDPQSPRRGLAVDAQQRLQLLLADGTAVQIPADTDPETLRRIIQRNDGERFEFPD